MTESIHDEPPQHSDDDSTIRTGLEHDPGVLKVYETGAVTVVGFGGQDVPDEVCIAAYRDQLSKLIDEQKVRVLAFDLTGVKLVPSGMLGLLTSLRKRVERIELYNASSDIRDVLRITNLDKLFDVKDVSL